jgi:hypothetical protein
MEIRMKKLAAALAVVALGLGVGALYLWQQLNDERGHSADLQAQINAMDAAQKSSAAALTAPPAGTPPGNQPVAATAANAAPTPASAPAKSAAPARTGSALATGAKELMSTPEGREMMRGQLRLMLPARYPDIAQELNLSPDQVDKLFDLLAKQQVELSADSIDLLGGGNADPAAVQQMQRKLQEKQQANEVEIQQLLGDKYPQWQDYQGTLAARQQVSSLQSVLNAGGNGLSQAQSKSLTAALAAEQKRISEEQRSAPPPPQGSSRQDLLELQLQKATENNKRLVDVASAQLDPVQLDKYRQMLDRQTSMARNVLRALIGQGAAQGQQAPASP